MGRPEIMDTVIVDADHPLASKLKVYRQADGEEELVGHITNMDLNTGRYMLSNGEMGDASKVELRYREVPEAKDDQSPPKVHSQYYPLDVL